MANLQTIFQRMKVRYLWIEVRALQSWPMYEDLRGVVQELRRNDGIISQERESVLKTK